MLLFKVLTFIPNLVKFGQTTKEQHQFCLIQDGGSRHVGFWQPGVFDSMDEFIFEVVTFLPNLMKFDQKMKEQHQFE